MAYCCMHGSSSSGTQVEGAGGTGTKGEDFKGQRQTVKIPFNGFAMPAVHTCMHGRRKHVNMHCIGTN